MKTNRIIILLITLFSINLFNACNQVNAPEITMHELGYENSKTVKRGTDLHVDAEIIADGKINTLTLTLNPINQGNDDWTLEETFTRFEGYKNIDFHEHFDISLDASPGIHIFEIRVVDMEGNEGIYEDEVEVLE